MESKVVDILWCAQHKAVGSQCCGGKKEVIGFMEIKEVDADV